MTWKCQSAWGKILLTDQVLQEWLELHLPSSLNLETSGNKILIEKSPVKPFTTNGWERLIVLLLRRMKADIVRFDSCRNAAGRPVLASWVAKKHDETIVSRQTTPWVLVMHAAQPGILAPVPGQSRYMEFGLVPEADVVPALHNLASKIVGQDIVIGVGPGLVEGLGQPIAGLSFEDLGSEARSRCCGTVRQVCRCARSSSDQSISAHAANSRIKQDYDPSASHIVLAFEKGFCLVEPETRLPIPRKSEFGGGNGFPTDSHGVRAVIHFHF